MEGESNEDANPEDGTMNMDGDNPAGGDEEPMQESPENPPNNTEEDNQAEDQPQSEETKQEADAADAPQEETKAEGAEDEPDKLNEDGALDLPEGEKAGEGDGESKIHDNEGEGQAKAGDAEGDAEAMPKSAEKSNRDAEGDQEDPENDYEKAAKDERYLWMISKMEELLDGFKTDTMWEPEYYSWLIDFLKDKDSQKLFAWIDLEDEELSFSSSGPPKIGGNIEQPQMV